MLSSRVQNFTFLSFCVHTPSKWACLVKMWITSLLTLIYSFRFKYQISTWSSPGSHHYTPNSAWFLCPSQTVFYPVPIKICMELNYIMIPKPGNTTSKKPDKIYSLPFSEFEEGVERMHLLSSPFLPGSQRVFMGASIYNSIQEEPWKKWGNKPYKYLKEEHSRWRKLYVERSLN